MNLPTSGINLSLINGHLICGLCGGYLINATVLTECIHVFCRSCILKYLMKSKVCPLCQSLIHETRPGHALRPDVVLQRIVYKLVPGLLKTEMERLAAFEALFTKSAQENSLKAVKELSQRTDDPNYATSAPKPFCPPLPTPLATRSLSKCPSALINSVDSSNQLPPDLLPSSTAFLVSTSEFVSLSLTQLPGTQTHTLTKSEFTNSLCASNNLKYNTQPLTPLSIEETRGLASIYLLCPSVVTVGNLHRLLLAKFQLDPGRQVVDLYLDGECLESSHSLREIAFLYSFPTRHQRMCLHFSFTDGPSPWWGKPMPRLERYQCQSPDVAHVGYDGSDLNSDNLHVDRLCQTPISDEKK